MRRPSGKVNLIGVVLIAGVMGLVYYAVMIGPAHLDNMSVREAIDIGLQQTRGPDTAVAEAVLRKINVGPDPVGWHTEENDNGELVEKKGLGLTDENITVERDETAKTMRIAVDYTRSFRLKPTNEVKVIHFHAEKQGPLAP